MGNIDRTDGEAKMPQKNNNFSSNDSLDTVKCECGYEILLVPDFREMGSAVEAHILGHCEKEDDPVKAVLEAERLWNMLVAQIFEKAAATAEGAEK